MPVEIKELHIKAVVGNDRPARDPVMNKEDVMKLKKEISKEVMEKILRLLKRKNER